MGKGGPKKKRPNDDNYLAFVQCTGPGVRYLPAESYILYEVAIVTTIVCFILLIKYLILGKGRLYRC